MPYIYHPIVFPMVEKFQEFLNRRISLSTAEWEKIRSVTISKKLRKGDFLFQEGDVWRYVAFVCAGCIRTYRTDKQGRIRILEFTTEESWAGDSRSLETGEPSVFTIDAVEDTALVLIQKGDFEKICQQIPQLNQLMSDSLKACLSTSLSRIDTATIYSAEEKYEAFIAQHSGLLNRIPQYMVASYLGITPESLSRVRKRVFSPKIN